MNKAPGASPGCWPSSSRLRQPLARGTTNLKSGPITIGAGLAGAAAGYFVGYWFAGVIRLLLAVVGILIVIVIAIGMVQNYQAEQEKLKQEQQQQVTPPTGEPPAQGDVPASSDPSPADEATPAPPPASIPVSPSKSS
jgi:predicted lipid-binding transport protein (Tim44 family)